MPLHVILALAALTLSTYCGFKPSYNKLKSSYILAGGTLASGVLLIFVNNASVLRTCMTGIIFFAVISTINELSRRRLIAQRS